LNSRIGCRVTITADNFFQIVKDKDSEFKVNIINKNHIEYDKQEFAKQFVLTRFEKKLSNTLN
jgi:hypothetical protein